MVRTPVCDLLKIRWPVVQAGMGGVATSAELVAAVCNAGGLGSLGAARRSASELREQLWRVRAGTDGPFAVNHQVPVLDEEAFAVTLAARPAVVSFALGDPGHLVDRAHDAGARVMQQVHTVAQARVAVERGVDVIVAQGSDAGGYGGRVASLALIPQVCDAVRPVPVLASGGIFDGRGLAAALVLGAAGISVGTRFLASPEAPVSEAWKTAIVRAASEDAARVEVLGDIVPRPGTGGDGTVLRALTTPFIREWEQRRVEACRQAERLRRELTAAAQSGPLHELLPAAGPGAGAIREVLPVAEIMQRILEEATAALTGAVALTA